MEATHRPLTRPSRRFVATTVCLTTAGLLTGGAGGYLIRAATSSSVSAPAIVAPATVQHRALNADSTGGYAVGAATDAPSHALNGDSASGY